ncbi:MAG TPA: response regulator [Pyrinomonadaceae bacterium]|nr:response regulator [Pyrinomonadaceae bacterium]
MKYGKTILVVEDDEQIRGQLALILGDEYEVVTARDGVEAITLYRRDAGSVALVLTDCEMPILNGIQLTVRLWRQDPELPVIMMTGGMERADFRGLLEMQNFALIWKPFDSLRLKELIGCMIERTGALAVG